MDSEVISQAEERDWIVTEVLGLEMRHRELAGGSFSDMTAEQATQFETERDALLAEIRHRLDTLEVDEDRDKDNWVAVLKSQLQIRGSGDAIYGPNPDFVRRLVRDISLVRLVPGASDEIVQAGLVAIDTLCDKAGDEVIGGYRLGERFVGRMPEVRSEMRLKYEACVAAVSAHFRCEALRIQRAARDVEENPASLRGLTAWARKAVRQVWQMALVEQDDKIFVMLSRLTHEQAVKLAEQMSDI